MYLVKFSKYCCAKLKRKSYICAKKGDKSAKKHCYFNDVAPRVAVDDSLQECRVLQLRLSSVVCACNRKGKRN